MPMEKPQDMSPAEYEAQIQAALAAVLASGLKPDGNPVYSLCTAARDFLPVSQTTLTARYKGQTTRQKAHEHMQILSPPQEDMLKTWVKKCGHWGIEITPENIIQAASKIAGAAVGKKWLRLFRDRHPNLKARWAAGLEACRAQALNRTNVLSFYNLLNEICIEFNIQPKDIYNMDEKGILMGIGSNVLVIVDREQASAKRVENGDRELTTILECMCADSTSIAPLVIFQGSKRDLEWGRNNPCKANIMMSKTGWTNGKIGLDWIKRRFEPGTRKKATGGYCLLIIDGHVSHVTYDFCQFAEKHKIIIICLPPHTTHALQPCDVGVFAPLSQAWRKEVNDMSRNHQPVHKQNFLQLYSQARARSITPATISRGFSASGIYPRNNNVIPETAYEPAKLTTTASAQPVPAELSSLLVPPTTHNNAVMTSSHGKISSLHHSLASGPTNSATSGSSTVSIASGVAISDSSSCRTDTGAISQVCAPSVISSSVSYILADRPALLAQTASREELFEKVKEMEAFINKCKDQIGGDHAQKVLMDEENERLRKQLFDKRGLKRTRVEYAGGARHMTNEECLSELAHAEWKSKMKAVLSDPKCKIWMAGMKTAIRRAEDDAKAEKVREERRRKDEEKAHERLERAEALAEEKREKAERKEQERAEKAYLKATAAEVEKQRKADERAQKKAEKAATAGLEKQRKANGNVGRGRGKARERPTDEEEYDAPLMQANSREPSASNVALPQVRPRPRPVTRVSKRFAVDFAHEEVDADAT